MAKRGEIYIQTDHAWLRFDKATTVVSETHSFSNEVVNQTLEDGSSLADHIIVLQDELECQVFVSNLEPQKSQDTYSYLKKVRNKRQLCQVFTDHEIYSNMAIESVSAPHEAPMVNAITFTIKFKRIDYAEDFKNKYPLAKFEEPLCPQLQAFDVGITGGGVYREQKLKRNSDGIKRAYFGQFEDIDDIKLSAVSKQDSGQILPLDNSQFPASNSLYEIMSKISKRNSFTEDEIQSFFTSNIGDTIIEQPTDLVYSEDDFENLSLDVIYDIIYNNISFIPNFTETPVTFNIISNGQVVQFEIYYNELLRIWKGEIKDAIGKIMLSNITLLAGNNSINGLQLKYRRYGFNRNIVVEDLVYSGLYVTEPDKMERVFEQGVENSIYAFTETPNKTSICYLCYFTNEYASQVYEKYMRGDIDIEKSALEEIGDYEII